MMNSSNQSGPVFAKTIVLGNTGAGRSTLIQNLQDCGPASYYRGSEDSYSPNKHYSINHDNTFFSAIELTPQELESSNQSAILKVWEYTEHLSKKDETMVFRGALFCIIVFDILNIDSYQAIFDKWIPLKERMSPDSFLYVVGTHLDQAQYRRVQLHDICKSCAKKDAVYVEVSNLDGFNFPLLRKLLCKRVQFMISKREELASRNFASFLAGTNNDGDNNSTTGSTHTIDTTEDRKRSIVGSSKQEISISYLEPNIMSSSVGSVMASYFGLESWEGLPAHESEMAKIAEKIDNFIEKLSSSAENTNIDLNNISVGEDLFRRESQDLPIKPVDLDKFDPTDSSSHLKSLQELQEALKVLGLNIPHHLLPQAPRPVTPQSEKGGQNGGNRANLRRMMIKLPHGQSGEMLLDLESNIEPQIDSFLINHGVSTESEAKKKLLQSTVKMQKEYLDTLRRSKQSGSRSSENKRD